MLVAIIQVRASSERLPYKAFLDLAGEPMLVRVAERVGASSLVNKIVVATSTEPSDETIAEVCARQAITCFRGSLDDVLARFLGVATLYRATDIVRITGDCPLVDPSIIDLCVEAYRAGAYEYQSNVAPGERTFPRGLDVEVISVGALERASVEVTDDADREHVTSFVWKNKGSGFRVGPILTALPEYAGSFRLTVDYKEDYDLMRHLYEKFYVRGGLISIPKVLRYLAQNPTIAAMNAFREAEHRARINV